jgi:hypothetical protein
MPRIASASLTSINIACGQNNGRPSFVPDEPAGGTEAATESGRDVWIVSRFSVTALDGGAISSTTGQTMLVVDEM